ncbi:NmrA/HSCARG family protein [Rhizobium deserti]|uniref:NmrA/HSCARG family protein n=1 Tax=Rhizobium deserti TaxID=2547961 RepID=A0A4R5UAW5_9HYPH|nr:NmrA/HSCARG family protein [Rhizobium deserti]TDK32183.1 NmrA/HSCARG family protein [Rhizobium deserti]
MPTEKQPILVFGATGQQGGSVAAALSRSGWPVRAMVRELTAQKSEALRDAGVELVEGSFDDADAMRAAMNGAYGVFSVQPSSPGGVVSDEDEVRYGTTIADLAVETGVKHLVYTSGSAAGDQPTGVAHYDTKAQIEKHIRTLPITSTIVRPSTFMELLLMPGFGLDQGHYTFFMHPERAIQVLAVEDIGKIVAAVFADPARFGGQTFEIASDTVSGLELQELFSEMAGRPIPYARFPDEVLAANPFLQKLAALVDDGRLAGHANLDQMRQINPELWSFKSWLQGPGRKTFEQALEAGGSWKFSKADDE